MMDLTEVGWATECFASSIALFHAFSSCKSFPRWNMDETVAKVSLTDNQLLPYQVNLLILAGHEVHL